MTYQITDRIVYEGAHCGLSVSGKGLPHPRDFGLKPQMISTGCTRGFYCEYTIRDNHLWLTYLVVNHDGDYPPIDGVHAIYEADRYLGEDEPDPEPLQGRWFGTISNSVDPALNGRRHLSYEGGIYAGLNVLAPLTGGILLGIGEAERRNLGYGLNMVLSSKQVLELLFEAGELVNTIDHSAVIAEKREQLLAIPPSQYPQYPSTEYEALKASTKEWLKSVLTRNYTLNFMWLMEVYLGFPSGMW